MGTKTFQSTWVTLVRKGKELGSGLGDTSAYELLDTEGRHAKPKGSLQNACAEMVREAKRKMKRSKPSRVSARRPKE